jgi:hypothetical protein
MTASDEQAQASRAKYGKVVAKAWSDGAFKAKLLSNPQSALAELGYQMPAGVRIEVVEDTATTRHLVLPPRPDGELSDEALEKVSGGLEWIYLGQPRPDTSTDEAVTLAR